jgi:hypothetical protein
LVRIDTKADSLGIFYFAKFVMQRRQKCYEPLAALPYSKFLVGFPICLLIIPVVHLLVKTSNGSIGLLRTMHHGRSAIPLKETQNA